MLSAANQIMPSRCLGFNLSVRHSRILLAGIQAGPETGPPIKTFGGDAFRINSHHYALIPVACCGGVYLSTGARRSEIYEPFERLHLVFRLKIRPGSG